MKTEIRMVGWPKRECEVIPVSGMNRKDIMRLTGCPYMTAVTAEKRGYYIIDYLKKGIPPNRGFVESPVDLGRERETIPIPEDINTIEGVMVHFNCNQKVAKASLARGYFIVDYNKRTVCPSLSEFDAEAAYRMVRFIYRRRFKDRLPWYIEAEDLIQEGVMRLLELSGHPKYQDANSCSSKPTVSWPPISRARAGCAVSPFPRLTAKAPATKTLGGTKPAMIGRAPWRRHKPGRATLGAKPWAAPHLLVRPVFLKKITG